MHFFLSLDGIDWNTPTVVTDRDAAISLHGHPKICRMTGDSLRQLSYRQFL
jgi:hypothetical protein